MQIKVSVKTAGVQRRLMLLYRDQVPFATSVAINETAKKVQEAERAEVQRVFKIRRPWVLQGVKIVQWARKHVRTAIVAIDEARDFLAKFERGGTKRPRDGGRLAVPDAARRSKSDVVLKSQRPRAFDFQPQGSGPKAETFAGNKRTFMIRSRTGAGGVFQRIGRGKASQVRMLFSFTRAARIPAILNFQSTAKRVVSQVFPSEFRKAFANALRTARR